MFHVSKCNEAFEREIDDLRSANIALKLDN